MYVQRCSLRGVGEDEWVILWPRNICHMEMLGAAAQGGGARSHEQKHVQESKST